MMQRKDFDKLFRDNYAAMHLLASRLLNDAEGARDIVHDIFASLIDSPSEAVTPSYLLRAVRNRCLNRIRDMAVRDRLHSLYTVDFSEIEDDEWPDEEELRLLERIVATLPPQCARVVNLRFVSGMSYREIALELEISESTVYKLLRHALDVLHRNFNGYGNKRPSA